MANSLNDRQAPASYSEADLRAARADQAAQMLAAENQRLQQMALYNQRPVQQVVARPSGPDPLKIFSEKNLTLTPEENQRLLDQGVRGRIRQEGHQIMDAVRSETRFALDEQRKELMLSSILSSNPDIANDPEGYAAAIGKAQFRTSNQNLDPVALAQLAVHTYRHDRGQNQQNVPFVEGAGRPQGFAGQRPDAPRPPSTYEQWYGAEDDVLHEEPWNQEAQVHVYLDGKNVSMEAAGAEPSKSGVQDVQNEARMRKVREKQRGAA